MGEFITIFIAILFSFILGVVVILFTGGKTTLQYLMVKAKRNSKIFIWVDTVTGRYSTVGNIEGDIKKGTVSFKWNGEPKISKITQKNVKRWKDIYYMALDIENPELPYNLTEKGEMYETSFDLKVYQNLLSRALTKPNLDDDLTRKILIGLGFGLLIVIGILFVLFFKVQGIEQAITTINVI